MKFRDIVLLIAVVVSVSVVLYVLVYLPKQKIGYVVTQQVFEQFEGKRVLESRLEKLRVEHHRYIDSLKLIISQNPNLPVNQSLDEQVRTLALKEREVSDTYTADIWKFINQYTAAYGKQNGYDYILGASGNGTIMYADQNRDITIDVVNYLNERYAEK